MAPGERIDLKQLTAGHSGMPETWFLERDAVTGAAFIGHTYWRVEEGGFRSRSANSWLLGHTLRGKVRMTVAAGSAVFEG